MTTAEKLPSVPRVTCGSYAGYKAHRKHNEIVCDFCKAARNAWEKDRRAARAEAHDRAQLTNEERGALLDAITADGGPETPWQHTTIAVVEALIADRLLRYT